MLYRAGAAGGCRGAADALAAADCRPGPDPRAAISPPLREDVIAHNMYDMYTITRAIL